MCGVHDGSVGIGNADRSGRGAFIYDGGGDSAKMSSATGVGNGGLIRRDYGRGGHMVTEERLL